MVEGDTTSACSSDVSPSVSPSGSPSVSPGASNPLLNEPAVSAVGDSGNGARQGRSVGVPVQAEAGLVGLPVHKPFLAPDIARASLPSSFVDDSQDPMASLLGNGPCDSDPSGFGLGSVADGTFRGRSRTIEMLSLFRSQKLLQAEAASIALNPMYVLNRSRLRHISSTLTRQIRQTVRDHTDAAVERMSNLADGASPKQQHEVVDGVRRNCHRVLTVYLDAARSSLREIFVSTGDGSVETADELGFRGRASLRDGVGTATNQPMKAELQQLASTWEDIATSMGSATSTHQPLVHMSPAMGRSGVFSLSQMRNHVSQPPFGPPGLSGAILDGAYPTSESITGQGRSVSSGEGSCVLPSRSMICEQSSLIEAWRSSGSGMGAVGVGRQTGMSSLKGAIKGQGDVRRPVPSNRKGSRHRLTPQAKGILEEWLAKHWNNPYPTEEEKISLAQACHITVTQVNNWMMNVRVRRCRTKKIGVATGPEQISYPANPAKALLENKKRGRSSPPHYSPATAPAVPSTVATMGGQMDGEQNGIMNGQGAILKAGAGSAQPYLSSSAQPTLRSEQTNTYTSAPPSSGSSSLSPAFENHHTEARRAPRASMYGPHTSSLGKSTGVVSSATWESQKVEHDGAAST